MTRSPCDGPEAPGGWKSALTTAPPFSSSDLDAEGPSAPRAAERKDWGATSYQEESPLQAPGRRLRPMHVGGEHWGGADLFPEPTSSVPGAVVLWGQEDGMEPIMTQIISILSDATKGHMRCSRNLRQRDLPSLLGWKRTGSGGRGARPGLGCWEGAHVSRTCPGPETRGGGGLDLHDDENDRELASGFSSVSS